MWPVARAYACSLCQVFVRLFGTAVHVYEPLPLDSGSYRRIATFEPPHDTEQYVHLLYRGGAHYDALCPL